MFRYFVYMIGACFNFNQKFSLKFSEMSHRRCRKDSMTHKVKMRVHIFNHENQCYGTLKIEINKDWKRKELRRKIRREIAKAPFRYPMGQMNIWSMNTRMRREGGFKVILHLYYIELITGNRGRVLEEWS